MLIPFSVPVVGLLAVVAQALFAAALLATVPANRLPNRLLALLLTAVALWELDAFGRVSGLYRQNPGLYFSPIYYSLAFGPLLWLYVRALTNTDFRFRWRTDGWHFGPVAVQAALYGWLRLTSYETRNWFWQTVHQPVTYRLEFIGTWVSLLVYLGLSLALLRRYARWLPDNFSELSALRLRWLRVVLALIGLVSAQWFVELVLREGFGRYYAYDYSTWLLGAALLLLGAGGLRQADMRGVAFGGTEVGSSGLEVDSRGPGVDSSGLEVDSSGPGVDSNGLEVDSNGLEVDSNGLEVDSNGLEVGSSGLEVGSSGLEVGNAETGPAQRFADPALIERLRRALETDRLFLNPTLTLAELSAHTGLAPRAISATLNAGFGRPFADVVNGLRVAEVKRRLAEPGALTRYTLLGIALEAGFNSKSTFNRVFKEITGVAPGEWQGARRA